MIEKAKIKKNLTKLFEIKEFIEGLLQNLENLKSNMNGKGKEVYYIKKEINELEILIQKIFSVNRVIHKNFEFKVRNPKIKKQNKRM